MNIRRQASGMTLTAILLSALVATVGAPSAFASVDVTTAGTVPQGGTSANVAIFNLLEHSLACFGSTSPSAAPYGASGGFIRIRILDSAGAATVHFVSPTSAFTPSLNATASVQTAATNVLEVLFNGAAAHDDLDDEHVIATAKISADAGAALGPIKANFIGGGPAGFTNQRECVLPTTVNAVGHLVNTEIVGSTAIEVTLDGPCDFQASGGGNGGLVFSNGGASEAVGITTAPFSSGGAQTLVTSPVLTIHPASQQVIQSITTVSCGFGTIPLGSPGTVAVSPPVLAFIAGPGTPQAGQPFPTNVQVAIQKGGATQTAGISASVTLAIGTNPSGGVLTCAGGTSAGTIAGIATFTGCSIDKGGTGYTLTATAANVVPEGSIGTGTSALFTVGSQLPPAAITLTTSCPSPDCPLDASKSPPQANIKLPQTLSEGVTLAAVIASGGANRTITFEVSKDQLAWSGINTTTTDASGSASFFYRPSDNRYYRASFGGAAGLGAGTSPVVRVVVRSLIFIRPTGCASTAPCARRTGSTVIFVATARPNRPELPQQQVQFVVQRKVGSTFVIVSTQLANVSKATGTASLAVDFSTAGTYRIRANLLPTSVNANSFPTEFEYYRIT